MIRNIEKQINYELQKLGKQRTPRVSAIGLGCMGMSHAYGAPADHREMTELLAKAVDMGYDFSTPPKYMARRTIRTTTRNCSAMP